MRVGTRNDLLDIIQDQHKAIDHLMAMVIQLDKEFRPTKSVVWPVVVRASNLLKVEGRFR